MPHRRLRLLLVSLIAVIGIGAGIAGGARAAWSDTGEGAGSEDLSVVDAVVLGVVEGVTEYLPISSTGHLIVVERLLGLGADEASRQAIDAYTVIIQFGAILAVVAISRTRVTAMARGLVGRDPGGRQLLTVVLAAFVPAAVVYLAFGDTIDEYLLDPGPVAAALIVGGIAILALTPWLRRRSSGAGRTIEELTVRSALLIGLLQSLALWPGTSRSLVTILGGLLVGLSLAAAVEFSFLIGLVTLSAASLVAAAKDGGLVLDTYGVATPLLGMVAAGIAAFLAVRSFVAFLKRRELTAFGYYRIGLGILVLVLMATTDKL